MKEKSTKIQIITIHSNSILKTMTLSVLLFFLCFLSVTAKNTYSQQKELSFSLKNTTIKQAFSVIEKNSDYVFLVTEDAELFLDNKVDLTVNKEPVDKVLSLLLENTDLGYVIVERQISVYKKEKPKSSVVEENPTQPPATPMKKITGTVVDTNGDAVIGANVIEKGVHCHGTATDIDGNFTLNVATDAIISVSYIGMETQEISVRGKSTFNITLDFLAEALDEVIVTGYQTISRERATGSFAVINPRALRMKLQPNILSRLEGQVSGLKIDRNGKMTIRGTSTLHGNTNPLVVVDGMPFEGDIKSINPSIIENITVLKDAAAASIYGARAANGVLVITTAGGLRDGKTHVAYNGSINITPIPDINKLDLLNSRELVDMQEYAFKFYTDFGNKRMRMNPVNELLLKHKNKQITDAQLEKELDHYRNLDNRKQIRNFFLRPAIEHQHNLSLSGGNDRNSYVASVNYMGHYGNEKYTGDQQMGFTLQNDIKFFKWLSGDLGIAGTFDTSSGDSGMGDYSNFLADTPSYFMLYDNNGNPLSIPRSKSDYELKRLLSIGLKDETYSPVTNRTEETFNNRNNYFRMHAGLKITLANGLTWETKYQQERSYITERKLYSRNSYAVRSMINDAAQYDQDIKKLTLNIPEGGQMNEYRGEKFAYTLRTQLNFNKEIDKHLFTALAGAERRLTRITGTRAYRVGYDDNTLAFKPIDLKVLYDLTGTESLTGSFVDMVISGSNLFEHQEDRFVSFYGNASYTYDYRYNFTGSIRMDQSNLFGTAPEVQYRPLWSMGAGWNMKRESFMQSINWLDNLNLRLTYGIGGNVPKTTTPFLMLEATSYDSNVDGFGANILYPPNPKLRWEKTTTTNLGIDFSFFGQALSGSIDFYNKYTTDLLAEREFDPTSGFRQVMSNSGTMLNRGFEVTLNGQLSTTDFQWNPSFTIGYNKNKLIDVYNTIASVYGYTDGDASVKGYPLGSVFGFRYAGLTADKGEPMYYNSKNEKTASITSISDLVFQGTNVPIYSAALTNTFSYKNIELSFMFVCNGGNVFRNQVGDYLPYFRSYNIYRGILNVWKKPGDELNETTTPGFSGSSVSYDVLGQWYAADKHVRNAAYIKLRDVSFSYNFSERITHLLNMESFSLKLQIQNLWTAWTANKEGIDPEAMRTVNAGWGRRAFPVPLSWTIGTAINF